MEWEFEGGDGLEIKWKEVFRGLNMLNLIVKVDKMELEIGFLIQVQFQWLDICMIYVGFVQDFVCFGGKLRQF